MASIPCSSRQIQPSKLVESLPPLLVIATGPLSAVRVGARIVGRGTKLITLPVRGLRMSRCQHEKPENERAEAAALLRQNDGGELAQLGGVQEHQSNFAAAHAALNGARLPRYGHTHIRAAGMAKRGHEPDEELTVRFQKLARSGSLGGMAAALAIGLAGPVEAQPPPGPGGPGPGAVVGGVLAGLGAAALLGCRGPSPATAATRLLYAPSPSLSVSLLLCAATGLLPAALRIRASLLGSLICRSRQRAHSGRQL
jgi:hypothetical protein